MKEWEQPKDTTDEEYDITHYTFTASTLAIEIDS